MKRFVLWGFLGIAASLLAAAEPAEVETAVSGPADGPRKTSIYVIPIRDQIAEPTLYIVRTGVKQAIETGAEFVVLDMNTPGGDGGVTFEIMKILHERFQGRTVTYVNSEAISAGALIAAATDDIYFTPLGVMGAAEPVSGTGEDLPETMRGKVVSYMQGRIRAMSSQYPYRGVVLSAMMDRNFEVKIDDIVIKEKSDKPLTLTGEEAAKLYGDPPTPLLASGISETREQLFETLAGSNDYTVREFEVTWSIELAQWITKLSPLLLSLGGLLLFIEFKTPGFGVIGIAGIVLIVIVLFGHHVAGLSGHEAMLVFVLGAALVFIEIFFFPGFVITAVLGIFLMLGALLWGMADIWPKPTGEGIDFSPAMFITPAYNLALGLLLAGVFAALLVRFLPKSLVWNRLVLATEVRGAAGGPDTTAAGPSTPAAGDIAVVVSDLHPGGRIEIGGQRYEARVEVGEVRAGGRVRILRRGDFGFIVEPVSE